jgi:hypothetical protein
VFGLLVARMSVPLNLHRPVIGDCFYFLVGRVELYRRDLGTDRSKGKLFKILLSRYQLFTLTAHISQILEGKIILLYILCTMCMKRMYTGMLIPSSFQFMTAATVRVRVRVKSYFTSGCLPPISSSWRQAFWDPRPECLFSN